MTGPDSARQNVTFPGGTGQPAHGYLAAAPDGRGPGLVVVQEWWGLTSHIATVVDRFAAEGFTVLAPDLYGGTTTHDREEAARLLHDLPVEQAARDLRGAVDFLLDHPAVSGDAVGVVGFCMGGGFALVLAAQEGDRVAAAVPFYGLPRVPGYTYEGLTAEVLGHYAEQDTGIPLAAVDEAAAAIAAASGRKPEIHFYPAGHAFMNDDNLIGTFDEEQAGIAWRRTVSFLHRQLDGRADR